MLLLERKVLSDQSVNLIIKQIVTFEISFSMKQSVVCYLANLLRQVSEKFPY